MCLFVFKNIWDVLIKLEILWVFLFKCVLIYIYGFVVLKIIINYMKYFFKITYVVICYRVRGNLFLNV